MTGVPTCALPIFRTEGQKRLINEVARRLLARLSLRSTAEDLQLERKAIDKRLEASQSIQINRPKGQFKLLIKLYAHRVSINQRGK